MVSSWTSSRDLECRCLEGTNGFWFNLNPGGRAGYPAIGLAVFYRTSLLTRLPERAAWRCVNPSTIGSTIDDGWQLNSVCFRRVMLRQDGEGHLPYRHLFRGSPSHGASIGCPVRKASSALILQFLSSHSTHVRPDPLPRWPPTAPTWMATRVPRWGPRGRASSRARCTWSTDRLVT